MLDELSTTTSTRTGESPIKRDAATSTGSLDGAREVESVLSSPVSRGSDRGTQFPEEAVLSETFPTTEQLPPTFRGSPRQEQPPDDQQTVSGDIKSSPNCIGSQLNRASSCPTWSSTKEKPISVGAFRFPDNFVCEGQLVRNTPLDGSSTGGAGRRGNIFPHPTRDRVINWREWNGFLPNQRELAWCQDCNHWVELEKWQT